MKQDLSLKHKKTWKRDIMAEPVIMAFVCYQWGYGAADLAGTSRMQYPTSVRPIRVPCTGKFDITYAMRAFEKGADAVFVAGWKPNECAFVV